MSAEPSITLSVSTRGAPVFEQTLTGSGITAGRGHDCELVLDDRYTSSRHFQLAWDGARYHFKDLGSSNGSWVNGQRTQEAALKQGDKIVVGVTEVSIRRVSDGKAEAAPAPVRQKVHPEPAARPPVQESEQLFENTLDRIRLAIEVLKEQHGALVERMGKVVPSDQREGVQTAHQTIEGSIRAIERALEHLGQDHRRLGALHAAAVMINRVTDLKERLNAILDLAIEIMEADCGFLILYNEKTRKISVSLHRGMALFDESSGELETMVAQSPTPSFSIAREVLHTRKTNVVTDIRHGSQFDESRSVMVQGVLAVLCAPMIFDDELIGLIYVDFREVGKLAKRQIGPGDRELFEALASLAATAIQNAKFFRNVQLEVEKRTNLQRYLSPELVEQVVRKDRSLNLEATRREASVLFCDIRNFTSFAESTEPERLIRQLNFFFSLMLKGITAENGSLDKYLGDGLMAFFGPLLDIENSEMAAVRAACRMQRSMAEACRIWQRDGWRSFQIGIGANVGEVVAGNLGSSERLEYTVIGDAVNVASRLSGVAKPGQILVTKAIADRLPPNEFQIVRLEPVSLKGKSEKIPVFEVRY